MRKLLATAIAGGTLILGAPTAQSAPIVDWSVSLRCDPVNPAPAGSVWADAWMQESGATGTTKLGENFILQTETAPHTWVSEQVVKDRSARFPDDSVNHSFERTETINATQDDLGKTMRMHVVMLWFSGKTIIHRAVANYYCVSGGT